MLQLSWNFKNVIYTLPSSDQCIFSKIPLTVDSDHKRPTTGQSVNIRLQTAQPETEHVSALSKGSWWKRGQKECQSQRQWVTTVRQYLLVRATAVLMNSLQLWQLHKTCASRSQTKSQKGFVDQERESWPSILPLVIDLVTTASC